VAGVAPQSHAGVTDGIRLPARKSENLRPCVLSGLLRTDYLYVHPVLVELTGLTKELYSLKVGRAWDYAWS
jgi:hypothetical protein